MRKERAISSETATIGVTTAQDDERSMPVPPAPEASGGLVGDPAAPCLVREEVVLPHLVVSLGYRKRGQIRELRRSTGPICRDVRLLAARTGEADLPREPSAILPVVLLYRDTGDRPLLATLPGSEDRSDPGGDERCLPPLVIKLGRTNANELAQLADGAGPLITDVREVERLVADRFRAAGAHACIVPMVVIYAAL